MSRPARTIPAVVEELVDKNRCDRRNPPKIASTLRTSIVSAFPRDVKIPEDKDVHFRAQKTIERFFGTAHHRFIFVEGSIQNDRNGSQTAELGDQLMVKRIRVGMDGLQPARAVHVTNGGSGIPAS